MVPFSRHLVYSVQESTPSVSVQTATRVIHSIAYRKSLLLGRIACTRTRPTATDVARSVVCVYVSGTRVSCAKRLNRSRCRWGGGGLTHVGPRNHVRSRWDPDSPRNGALLRGTCCGPRNVYLRQRKRTMHSALFASVVDCAC